MVGGRAPGNAAAHNDDLGLRRQLGGCVHSAPLKEQLNQST